MTAAKLFVVILALGAVAAALLVHRQQRFETAFAAAQLHAELAARRQAIWQLDGEIAALCRPHRLETALRAGRGAEAPAAGADDKGETDEQPLPPAPAPLRRRDDGGGPGT